jgi:CheY-like chemotaxis protein
VDVRSAGTGAGTEVVIELPVLESAPVPDERGPARVKPSRALRILVADDSEDARDTMRSILERDGHVVRTAADGREAIEAAASFDPEVAILDIGMPGLNGLGVATELRKRRVRPPVLIAVSGLGQDEDKRRAKESGFDVHFTKPVDVHALTAHLARAAERRP